MFEDVKSTGFNIRRNVKQMNDVNYNFHQLYWLLSGHLDEGNLNEDSITTRHVQADTIITEHLQADSIVTEHIQADTITTEHLQADSVVAEKMDVDELSAITANVGELTAGIITGLLIRTSKTGAGVELDDTGLFAYDSDENLRIELSEGSIGDFQSILKFYQDESVIGEIGHTDDWQTGMRAYTTLRFQTWKDDPINIWAGGWVTFQGEKALFNMDNEVEINGDLDVNGDIDASHAHFETFQVDTGWSGSFTNGDGATVSVNHGIITGVA